MEETMQFQTLNVLEHGLMVKKHFDNFFTMNELPKSLSIEFAEKLFSNITTSKEEISFYQTYHDLGKPFCLHIDEEGKRHFPNHAQISRQIYERIVDINHSEEVAWFIEHDMDLHKIKMEEWEEYVQNKTPNQLSVLFLTYIAEINANREMFGETSFKIKLKKAEQLTKRLLSWNNQ